MSLVACPDCSRQVSAAAAACPHCGRPHPGTVAPPAASSPVRGPGRAARRSRYQEASSAGRYAVYKIAAGTAGVLLLLAFYAAGPNHAATRDILSNVLALVIGLGLVLAPEGDETRHPPPPGTTWGNWFAAQDRERTVQWNVMVGGVIVIASLANLALTLFDPFG